MGTSGSGKFGNYPTGSSETVPKKGQNGISIGDGVGGGVGGGVGEFECPEFIEHIRLEDVAVSEYFINNNSLPNPGDAVELKDTIYKGRLVIISTSIREIIGNLPTQNNNLINCIKREIKYIGTVISSGKLPVPYVMVSLHV